MPLKIHGSEKEQSLTSQSETFMTAKVPCLNFHQSSRLIRKFITSVIQYHLEHTIAKQ